MQDSSMRFGLVTYLWGDDLDLATLIDVCETTELQGVELRTEHAHAVEPSIGDEQRQRVRELFENSPVELVGYGSNAQFHISDTVSENIELTKDYVHLMHDCGGTGVKVKPNGFVEGVSHDATIAQIGDAIGELAEYAEGYGQAIRVEAHGRGTSDPIVMRQILDRADHGNAGICWNCNAVDVEGDGFESNFQAALPKLTDTLHIGQITDSDYPYARLFELLHAARYDGWILLEARSRVAELDAKIEHIRRERMAFEQMIADFRDRE